MQPVKAVIEPAQDVMSTRVGDEMILLELTTSEYFGLRGSAVRMWELIEEKTNTRDDLVRRIVAEFDADERTIRGDVATTLETLSQRGLIRGDLTS
jgi:hypothetical protein